MKTQQPSYEEVDELLASAAFLYHARRVQYELLQEGLLCDEKDAIIRNLTEINMKLTKAGDILGDIIEKLKEEK